MQAGHLIVGPKRGDQFVYGRGHRRRQVDVVRDVDRKGIMELAAELAETSGKAREGKLKPQDIQKVILLFFMEMFYSQEIHYFIMALEEQIFQKVLLKKCKKV